MSIAFPGLAGYTGYTAADSLMLPAGDADKTICEAVERMKLKARRRDEAIARVLAVREGRFSEVWPGFFSDKFPASMVANFVDVAARDFAANLAPLPSLACSAGSMKTDLDKRRAEKRNRIGGYYWQCSKLAMQMKFGADQYVTYGFMPIYVEADHDRQMPVMLVEDPRGAYFEMDRWGNVVKYVRCWRQSRAELAAQYPEYAARIVRKLGYSGGEDVEVVRYVDDKIVCLYIPDCNDLVLGQYPHRMGYCPAAIAVRPGVTKDPRGQFDDVLWIQLGAMVMATLTLEAGHKAVQAPIAVPPDMMELPTGPDAILVTDQPDKVRRIPLEVPSSVFALSQQLQQEMSTGGGLPDSRLGQAPPGGTTGRGVSALQGGYSSQISEGQDMIGEAIRRGTEMCFDMDRTYWPTKLKEIQGLVSGESFQIRYVPDKEIDEYTTVHVDYGFSAGQSPQGTIITMLQLRGDNIIGRDTFRRNLPFTIDVDQQQRELDAQLAADSMMQGLAAGNQAIGQMITAGRVDVAMQFLNAGAAVIKGRSAGRPLADILTEAFAPPPAPPQEPGTPPGAPGAPGAAPPGGDVQGVGPDGLPQGVAPGQAGLPPGGRPSVTDLAAGFLSNGAPNSSATVRRRIPTG